MSISKFAWIVVYCCVLIVISVVYHAYAFQHLWEWFITPEFALNPPSTKAVIGIFMLVTMLTYRSDLPTKKHEDVENGMVALFSTSIVAPTFYLVLGYIVHVI